jgi:hypothetical protein
MKLRTWKSMFVALPAAVVLAGAVSLSPARGVGVGAGEPETQARQIEGTWRVQITIRNCQTGEALRTFPALSTFARGGTLNTVTAGNSPARVSADYGVWRHTGGQTYSAVSDALLFGPAGEWVGTQRVTRALVIGEDPDEVTASVTAEFIGPDGNPIPGFPPTPICSTAVGRRM